MTAEKFKDYTGAEVKARKVDGSTYYFKDDDNVMYISLSTADSNNVMVLSEADKNNKVATTNVKAFTKDGITVELAGGVLTGDIWVYQAPSMMLIPLQQVRRLKAQRLMPVPLFSSSTARLSRSPI